MDSADERLRSFMLWPDFSAVGSVLANDGFYAVPGGQPRVKCHSCDLVVILHSNDRTNVSHVKEIHRTRSQPCAFLLGQEPTNNTRSQSPSEMKDEQKRLESFVNWPVAFMQPTALAKAGFYYTQRSDEVECPWCFVVIGRWEVGDDPFTEHARFFPSCQKVIANALVSSDPPPDPSIGIQPVQLPHNPRYSSLDARIRSFENWNHEDIQRGTGLAEAGFYYLGEADEVRCFHCDGGLRLWLPTDDPWFEHARCFADCQFLLLVKGQQFVENVQGRVAQQTEGHPEQQHQQQGATQSISVVDAHALITPRRMTLDDALTTEPVQMALQMGLNIGRIRAATMRKLHTTGEPYLNSQQLVEAILEDQLEEEDIEPSTSSWMGRRFLSMDVPCRREQQQERAGSTKECSHASLRAATDCEPEKRPEVPEPNGQNTLTEEAAQRLQEENKRLKDARECKICMSEEVGVVFCPCGHLVSCVQCAPAVLSCPVCRATIKGRVRTFLS
ncbi:death-associated inhibitor of apoptosis 2 [Anopheles bellator]|uniref:death-associated inhibitor of apoptosis 2 n=1 Tax=Anopheles bellator TaxID=139047 RepID=UPI002649B062|nr:death-associated inhibitor of apoptosis 2 [Anopheles bellator]